VFCGNFAVHVPGQLIPAGLLVTLPVPLPDVVTVSAAPAVNVAVTVSAAVMVSLHVDEPVQAPLQPPKRSLLPGVALRVTCMFCGKLAVQVPGQLIPAGLLVMVPPLAGDAVTAS